MLFEFWLKRMGRPIKRAEKVVQVAAILSTVTAYCLVGTGLLILALLWSNYCSDGCIGGAKFLELAIVALVVIVVIAVILGFQKGRRVWHYLKAHDTKASSSVEDILDTLRKRSGD
jgi:uncharacterized membrane protein